MKTVLEVILKIDVESDLPLDENSVKSLVNKGKNNIFRNRRILSTIGDQPIESVSVSVVGLSENGREQALSLYGTDAVSWND